MKKIVRGILIGVAAVIVIAIAAVAIFMFGGKKPDVSPQPYVVDQQGMSYLAVVDGEGVTYAAVTDAVGNVYAAEIDQNGNIGETKGQINDQVDKEKMPSNYTGVAVDDRADVNAFTGSIQGEVTDQTAPVNVTSPTNGNQQQTPSGATSSTTNQGGQSATNPTQSQTTAPAKQKLRVEKYQEMFKSKQYLLEFKTSDPTIGDAPITMATKNGNVIITTKIENFDCKMLYLARDNTTYLLIDAFKKYCKLPEDMMGDESLDMSAMMDSFTVGENDNMKTSTVTVGGQTLNCESRVNDDGSQTKYYFNGDTLVRIDNVDANGTTDSTFISRLTSDVPDSMFEIPKNYGYINLSLLEGLVG